MRPSVQVGASTNYVIQDFRKKKGIFEKEQRSAICIKRKAGPGGGCRGLMRHMQAIDVVGDTRDGVSKTLTASRRATSAERSDMSECL